MRVAVLLELETEDPHLLAPDVSTVESTAALRSAVKDGLATGLRRVIAVLPVELAQILMDAHNAAMKEIGNPNHFPPLGYVAPDDRH